MSFEVLRDVRRYNARAVELELDGLAADSTFGPGPDSLMREGLPIADWRALPDS